MWRTLSQKLFGNRERRKKARNKSCKLGLENLESRLVPSSLPQPSHVLIVIEENKAFSQIIGSSSAPYINSLAQQGALMTNSFAITHPSQPNYLDFFSGENQGVSDDTCPPPGAPYSTANLGGELIAAGDTFGGYSEGMPSVGYTGCSSGEYVRKHNPWVDFTNVPSADNMPFTSFPANFSTLPTVSIVVPNLLDDMHDGTIQQGDTWLKNNIDPYVQWAKNNNSLLIVTWDEDDFSTVNKIATIFVGPMVKVGTYAETINHFNVMRTLEDMYGLPYAGASSTATPITDIWPSQSGVPAAPSNLTATPASTSQINLTWTDNSTNETGILVERSTNGTTFNQIASLGANVTSYSNTGLSANTTYYYRVRAYNSVGDSSYSNVASTTTSAPAAPTNLTAIAVSGTQINLAWIDNSNNEAGFLVERSTDAVTFTQIASLGTNVTSYSDTGLTSGMTYYYRVRANNAIGKSAYSNVARATPTSATPTAPSNLTAAAFPGGVNLSWTDNSNNETGFTIERSTDSINFSQIASVGANFTSYSDTNLTAPKYYYRVRAYNGVGNSAYSNIVDPASLYVSTTGSDSNSGASPTSALRSIQTALNRASPGMTIYISGGTYYEHLVTKVSGAAGEVITLTSYNGTVVINGSTQTWTPGGNQNLGVIELRNPYYIVQGIEVINSKDSGIVLGANHLTVTNSTVAETDRHAISTDTRYQTASGLGFMLNDITITNNLVYGAVLLGHGYGQAISLIADGFQVSGNTVRNNVTEGIDIWLGAKHGVVDHNAVYSNGAAGIYVDGAAYIRIDDNRVYSNPRGIGVSSENPNYSTHDIWVYNNLSYNNTGSGIFIWDSPTNPGYHGSQNVLIANNTLVNNKTSIVLQGDSNTAEIMNNLGYATGSEIYNTSTNSTYNIHNNVWLTAVVGFVSPSTGGFELTSTSPAIDMGATLPVFHDDLGDSFVISTDFLGLNRNVNGVDAGAYEYQ